PPGSAAVSTDRLASANGSISREDSHLVAPAELRQKLLGLAGRQGILDSHELLRVSPNGSSADSCRQLLARIFGGEVEHLEPVAPVPVQFIDNALNASQREAIAKALATPDLCLIQGLPGRDKSRVIAEIVTQAAARGERVLLLARSTVAIDAVVER